MPKRQQSLTELGALSATSSKPAETDCPDRDVSLTDAQEELVATMRRAARQATHNGKPLAALVRLWVADQFEDLLRLKQQRNLAVQYGDVARAHDLNTRIEELQIDLKQAGIPYHPAMDGNRGDYSQLSTPR